MPLPVQCTSVYSSLCRLLCAGRYHFEYQMHFLEYPLLGGNTTSVLLWWLTLASVACVSGIFNSEQARYECVCVCVFW